VEFLGLFKIDDSGKTHEIHREEFSSERQLESLIQKNPEVVLEGKPLLIIGRQVSTDLGSVIDLLGISASGNTVIIELKKGRTPREVLTQILEYGVWVQTLGYAELNKISIDNVNAKSIRELYMDYFTENGLLENIIENVNKEQLLVVIAKEIDQRIESISRYLREKGINLRCLKYSFFSGESGEKYLHIDTIVGKEAIRGAGIELPPVSEVNAMLDTTIREIKSQEFTAPDVYEKFAVLFPDEMDKLKERYKNIPHFSSKTYIARGLDSYSRRESAPFIATDKLAQAHSEWGFPQVKVYKKKI
jgi:hypothetical protein